MRDFARMRIVYVRGERGKEREMKKAVEKRGEESRLALHNAWLELGELRYYEVVHSGHVLLVGIALQPALMRRTLYRANEVASSVLRSRCSLVPY